MKYIITKIANVNAAVYDRMEKICFMYDIKSLSLKSFEKKYFGRATPIYILLITKTIQLKLGTKKVCAYQGIVTKVLDIFLF